MADCFMDIDLGGLRSGYCFKDGGLRGSGITKLASEAKIIIEHFKDGGLRSSELLTVSRTMTSGTQNYQFTCEWRPQWLKEILTAIWTMA